MCLSSFQFLGILMQDGLDDLDGILGLSPDVSQNGPSFIKSLKGASIINQKIASFFIGNLNQQSTVLFGGYDTSFLKSEIVWLPLVGNTWWQVKMINT